MVQTDYSRVSRTKVKMTILLAIATKSEITIDEFKTPAVLTHLKKANAFVSEQQYDEIGVDEIGFFSKMHEKITNRNELHRHIAAEYQEDHGRSIPKFELYTKPIYARFGHTRANTQVLAIRTGRSNVDEMTEYFCQLASEGAFGNAVFVPRGVENKTLISKIQAQNKYLRNTTTIPIIGLTQEILGTPIKTETRRTSFQEYILDRTEAERFEATENPDRWLLVLPSEKKEKAQQFIDNEFHEMFNTAPLPQNDKYGIPYRPGSKHSHSPTYNKHAQTLENEISEGLAFLRPPPQKKQPRIVVSYAAVAAKAAPSRQPKTMNNKPQKQNPVNDIKRMRQSFKQQLHNTNVELHADLESQVCSLQAQIQALQNIINNLQEQVHSIVTTFQTSLPNKPTNITTNDEKEPELEEHSPRERAPKRHRSSQLQATAPAFEPELQEMDEESLSKTSDSQPNPPADPNFGMDPGEADSTLL